MSTGDEFPSHTPRVLFIGAGAPWRGGAGYLARQQMFLAALAECAQLDLALFDYQPVAAPAVAPPGPVTALPMPDEKSELPMLAWLRELASPLPASYRRADVEAIRKLVQRLRPDRFTAVFAYRPDFAYFAGVIDHPNLLLDIDDPEHLRRRQRVQALDGGRMGLWTRLELSRLRRFERAAARHARTSFVCQRHDQAAFAFPLPHVVPNCVDVPDQLPPRPDGSPTVLFVGNLDAGPESPNVDALCWFAREVWPLIHSQAPAARLKVVGRVKQPIGSDLATLPGVEVVGFVPDLAEAFGRAALSVAPIRFGTGTRVKIIESMAWGCPVVSTPKGCEGLEAVPGRDLLVGRTPHELAELSLSLLTDRPLQAALSQSGFRLVRALYDRKRVHLELVKLLDNALRQKG